jgi:predicted Zn-dependent protease
MGLLLAAACTTACRAPRLVGPTPALAPEQEAASASREADGAANRVLMAYLMEEVAARRQMLLQWSPEQEREVGRAVAARAVAEHGLDLDAARQGYVQLVGASLVERAERVRATYGGWHFALLAAPHVEVLTGPGGYVFLTRGALEACQDEDELAGLLAHGIASVTLRHGEGVVHAMERAVSSQERFQRFMASSTDRLLADDHPGRALGSLIAQVLARAQVRRLDPPLTLEADREGAFVLYEAGYDCTALERFLLCRPGIFGEPTNLERAAALEGVLAPFRSSVDEANVEVRAARFRARLGKR